MHQFIDFMYIISKVQNLAIHFGQLLNAYHDQFFGVYDLMR